MGQVPPSPSPYPYGTRKTEEPRLRKPSRRIARLLTLRTLYVFSKNIIWWANKFSGSILSSLWRVTNKSSLITSIYSQLLDFFHTQVTSRISFVFWFLKISKIASRSKEGDYVVPDSCQRLKYFKIRDISFWILHIANRPFQFDP